MGSIAKVVVEISLDREFDYRIPGSLRGVIRVGSQVTVPFRGREIRGFVTALVEHSEVPPGKLKALREAVGDKPLIPVPVMKLAEWIAEYYCAPIEAAVRTVLPGAVRRRGARHKTRRIVTIAEGAEVGDAPPLHRRILEVLRENGPLSIPDLRRLAACSESPIRTLRKRGALLVEETSVRRDPHAGMELLRTEPFSLMEEQTRALESIVSAMDRRPPDTVLLHGVTGSGKTEVYLQAIQRALDRGEGAIVLVPEISLTPQTVDRFRSRFGEGVAVLHSALSDGERHDEWHRIRNGEARIVVGARSALFAPVERPGLIVVDEEHESTYKQDEAPRYNARDVAVMRGRMEGCCVVLGSATPSMESYRNARIGRYVLATMRKRIDDRSMPLMRAVDMRIEMERDGRPRIFSRELVEAIYDRLDRREQTILFLNRRGFSSALQCKACGFVEECDDCSLSMSYHKGAGTLRCHLCGGERAVPARCPECGDPEFGYPGVGTERIEEILAKICPRARTVRMDSDTMRRKDAYRQVLDDFRAGKIDVLLGTQMIAKGLDFPNVTLVGVLNADLSLHVPDFRAGERTFQLLTQVAGRAGRGDRAGEVIVQTRTPEHPAVRAALEIDYAGFSEQDLEFREAMGYPPFARIVALTFKGKNEEAVRKAAEGIHRRLERALPKSVIRSEPMPAPLARAKGQWRRQLLLRCAHAGRMTGPVRRVLASFRFPLGVTCTVDVDPTNLS